MKILYLITKSESGGAQTHVNQLCEFFHTKYNITVVAYPGGWLEEKCKELGIRFIANDYFSNSINPFNVLKSYHHIKKIVKNVQPDIVHAHSSVAGFLGRLAVRNKIPTLFTAHGWGFNIGVGFFQKWLAIIAEKLVSKYTTKIICVSEFIKDLGLKYGIAKENKFELIYNGVKIKEQRTRNKEQDHNKINVVFIGRLAPPKRPLLLLEAIEKLPTEIKNKLHVSIVGDGPQKNELEKYIGEYNIQNVSLVGMVPREEIFDILQNSDIFVLLSDWEGLPITILEAMSCGLPIIASDVGGIKEMVYSDCGILIQNNNVETLKTALSKLLYDTELRIKMGENSKQRIEGVFSESEMFRKVETLYFSLN